MPAESTPAAAIELAALVGFLDELLDPDSIPDHCPNGLQVEGRSRVRRLVTGVSACAELFREARRREADAVLVHHGLFWRGTSRALIGIQYHRVVELIRGELSLIAYHLPLDRHAEVGNNAVAAQRLGLVDRKPFGKLEDQEIGIAGQLETAARREEIVERVAALYRRDPLVFAFGDDAICRVAIVSGAGSRFVEAASAAGIDLFVTGEVEEWTMNQARELGINVVAAGHYATERLGVQALGQVLQRRFDLAVDFVDIPNPV